MQMPNMLQERIKEPGSQKTLKNIQLLVNCYLGLSVLTLVAIVLLRNNTELVTTAVWVRGIIVVASALLTTLFANQAVRGSSSGYLRLRLVSAIMVVAIIVIIALPGTFPLWMKLEQSVCGLLLLIVAVLVNSKQLRTTFANSKRKI